MWGGGWERGEKIEMEREEARDGKRIRLLGREATKRERMKKKKKWGARHTRREERRTESLNDVRMHGNWVKDKKEQ